MVVNIEITLNMIHIITHIIAWEKHAIIWRINHYMVTIKDHQTSRLFDPWDYVGPKRRKLLDRSWSEIFRTYLPEKLPVHRVARYFDEAMGCPGKELYTAIGCIILQQLHDLSDPDVTRALAFNPDWHYALDITDESDAGMYLSERTLRTYRKILEEEGLDVILFKTLTDKLLRDLGEDLLQLIELFCFDETVRELSEYKLLERVLHEQCLPVPVLMQKSNSSRPKRFPRTVYKTLQTRMPDMTVIKVRGTKSG